MKRRTAALVLALAAAAPAWADRSTEQLALAAAGRFAELERQLEAQDAGAPLATPDLHLLCYAQARLKRHARLLPCLDRLQAQLATGSRHTRLFALDDATPSIGAMRTEALVELGQYGAAIEEGRRTLAWLEQEGSDDLDMFADILAALSVAHTLSGERAKGLHYAGLIGKLRISFFSEHARARSMALARARMALGDYPGVLAALAADKTFRFDVFMDRLASGSGNWAWVELPRAWMQIKALIETGRAQEARPVLEHLLTLPDTRQNGELYRMLLDEQARLQ